jgi:hypothetical protein
MSKLDNILNKEMIFDTDTGPNLKRTKRELKALMLELIGDMEERETDDMALKSWTPEDYKAFGRNELRGQLMKDINNL